MRIYFICRETCRSRVCLLYTFVLTSVLPAQPYVSHDFTTVDDLVDDMDLFP